MVAACGLSTIRYVAFPPVVFETPAPKAVDPEPAESFEPLPEPREHRVRVVLPAEPQAVDAASLPEVNWFFAYNAFRLAGILQGIVGRVRDGTANSPQAAAMADRVPNLAQSAWAFAKKAGA